MKKQRFMDQSVLICPVCNKSFPIMRPHGQQRGKNHIKDIWCPYCKTIQKFKEIRRGDCYMKSNGNVVYV